MTLDLDLNIIGRSKKYKQSKNNVFFNYKRDQDRLFLLEIINRLKIKNYFDLFSGSGVRSILVNKKFKVNTFTNDFIDLKNTIETNLRKYEVKSILSFKNIHSLQIIHKPNSLFDFDCFGSPIELLESFIFNNKTQLNNTYFTIFNSDHRILRGNLNSEKLNSRYKIKYNNNSISAYTGLTIFISRINEIFEKNNLKIKIINCYYFQHFFQIIIKCVKKRSLFSKLIAINKVVGYSNNLKDKFYDIHLLKNTRFNKIITSLYKNKSFVLEKNKILWDYRLYFANKKMNCQSFKEIKNKVKIKSFSDLGIINKTRKSTFL